MSNSSKDEELKLQGSTLQGLNEATEAACVGPDDGSPRARREPRRQCALTRTIMPKSELIRFVADPDGRMVPDLKAVLPGRGVWITADRASVTLAEQRKLFGRLLEKKAGRSITVEPGLADRVEKLLVDRALGALALAQKSGRIITGFAKVEAAVTGDKLVALICARDGAEDSLRKLKQAVKRRWGITEALPLFRSFDTAELDLAFGRTNVIHAALTRSEKKSDQGDGGFLKAAGRLQRYAGARANTDQEDPERSDTETD